MKEKIIFDDDARRTFLTGFHKRKVARQEQARQRAQLREKQQRRDARREHRRELAERAARNAAAVEKAYGMETEPGDELSREPDVVEEEFESEEQLATVTIVQDIELSGPSQTRKRAEPRETKAARRVEQRKRRARRTEKAGRAGRKRK